MISNEGRAAVRHPACPDSRRPPGFPGPGPFPRARTWETCSGGPCSRRSARPAGQCVPAPPGMRGDGSLPAPCTRRDRPATDGPPAEHDLWGPRPGPYPGSRQNSAARRAGEVCACAEAVVCGAGLPRVVSRRSHLAPRASRPPAGAPADSATRTTGHRLRTSSTPARPRHPLPVAGLPEREHTGRDAGCGRPSGAAGQCRRPVPGPGPRRLPEEEAT